MIGAIAGGAAAAIIQAQRQRHGADDPYAQERADALCARDVGGILGLLLAIPAGICIAAWVNGTFQWEARSPAPWWLYLIFTSAFALPSLFCITAAIIGWLHLGRLPSALPSVESDGKPTGR